MRLRGVVINQKSDCGTGTMISLIKVSLALFSFLLSLVPVRHLSYVPRGVQAPRIFMSFAGTLHIKHIS